MKYAIFLLVILLLYGCKTAGHLEAKYKITFPNNEVLFVTSKLCDSWATPNGIAVTCWEGARYFAQRFELVETFWVNEEEK